MRKITIKVSGADLDEFQTIVPPDFPISKTFVDDGEKSIHDLAQTLRKEWRDMHGETPTQIYYEYSIVGDVE